MPLRRRPWPVPLLAAALLLTGCAGSDGATSGIADEPQPRGVLDMTGDVGDYEAGVVDDPVHDPTVVATEDAFYVFSTGVADPADPGGIFVRRSTGTLAGPWESLGAIPLPDWTRDYGVGHLWAPHVVEADGELHLYYSASSFGSNTSAIGHATSATPADLDSWVDHGPILTSGEGDDVNAIDPMVFDDGDGWWIAFGSFWSGIQLQRLEGMDTPVGPVTTIAARPDVEANPIENAQIFAEGDHWYLAVSWDFCCQGTDSTYRVAVGRADEPAGPYTDRDGVPMTEGGGTVLLDGDPARDQVGTGALDVVRADGRWYAVHHYYDAADGGTIRMQVREVEWDDGWPVLPTG